MSAFSLSAEQQEAVFFPSQLTQTTDLRKKHLVIEAGAGAGKTRVLTERVHWLLCTAAKKYRLSPAELILVTFSKAADEELRQRVEQQIKRAAISGEDQQRILGRLHISTIDSLFMQIAGNLFPTWWEQTKNNLLSEQQSHWKIAEQRFPPAVTLVSESEILPELCDEIINILEEHCSNVKTEIELLDFILSGAFQSQSSFASSQPIQPRYRGLERLSRAMLHENILREDAPPLRFALEKIHPSSLEIINIIQTKARELFHKRLMQGRMTHNDRMMFLYHLLCLPTQQPRSGFFALAEQQLHPLRCSELIVDEYQDTNELQHKILTTLLDPNKGRMVVVGDPKQSIYGFRSAHVGVFQKLKSDELWKLIELTRNYRSHPELLPFINLLSDLTFSYRNDRIPEEFRNTLFAMTAQQTFVGAKSLDAGRTAQPQDTETNEKPMQRVMLLGASLSKTRSDGLIFDENLDPNAFAAWALARELRKLTHTDQKSELQTSESAQLTHSHKKYDWSDIVILCETNIQVAQTQSYLMAMDIPAVAKLSRPPEDGSQRQFRSEMLGLLLAKWLCRALEPPEFSQFVWSGWLELNRDEASQLLKASSEGLLESHLVSSGNRPTKSSTSKRIKEVPLPARWNEWVEHLLKCRTLASRHFFSAWQLLRWGFQSSPQNLAMENTALALHSALEVWSIRERLENGGEWPEEYLLQQLQNFRLSQYQRESTQDAVTLCTIHGAKGLEWPIVVFWPNSARDRAPENFVMKSHEDATFIKWLAEDKESASLVSWISNPHPPDDRVSIQTELKTGEQQIRWSADLQEKLEQDFERQRVFYTAFTRAEDMLIVMSPSLKGRARSNLRDKLAPLKKGDSFDPVALKLNGLEYNVLGLFADMAFDLRKEAKRGAKPATPWIGLETDAASKVQDWTDLVCMRDYSPAWLSQAPELQTMQNKTAQSGDNPHGPGDPQNQQNQQNQLKWIPDWLKSQHEAAKLSPWQKQLEEKIILDKFDDSEEIGGQTIEHTSGQKISSAEEGLRFHAYMEHADPRRIQGRGFLQQILSSATLRAHELEIWSVSDIEPSPFKLKRGLLETQRRIIDLFCVIPTKSFPKQFWQSACVRCELAQEQSKIEPRALKTTLSTLHECLSPSLNVHPQLHMVIDFKTGAPAEEHIEQMARYLSWVRDILATHPQQLVNDVASATLFADDVKPLVGMIYYTTSPTGGELHNFASTLVSVDKNASVLFISPD